MSLDAIGPVGAGRSLPSVVTSRLHGLIVDGTLAPGERLPSIAELSRRFGISIAGVRESLSALEAAGLIEVRHGHGTFVRERPPLQQVLAGWLSFGVDPNELRGLNEARHVLEDALVRFAAERASPAEQEGIMAAVDAMAAAVADVDRFVDADARFHLAVAEAAHNPVLLRLMNALATVLRQQFRLHVEEHLNGGSDLGDSVERHRRVARAIAAGDAEEASAAMDAILDLAARFARARARRAVVPAAAATDPGEA
jgi:GntR family transcriptional regulator, transcriptional repressor for pyruvate dehydrogenase complex